MALATQCPHCQTIFRVAHDQLKLRAGLVRCGKCKEVFNGIEHLLPAETPAPAVPPNSAESKDPVVPRTPASDGAESAPRTSESPNDSRDASGDDSEPRAEFIDFFDLLNKKTPDSPAAPKGEPEGADVMAAENDPLQRMTLVDLREQEPESEAGAASEEETLLRPSTSTSTPTPAPDPDAPDPLDIAIENLHRKPVRAERRSRARKESHKPRQGESDEPSFVKSGRRREQVGRTVRIALGIASAVMLIGALGQGIYLFRSQLAAHLPQTRPALEQACSAMGCKVRLPAQIDAIAIEGDELQGTAAKDIFVLSVLLRNRSGTAQEWPNIELTLNDAGNNPIARKVFAPRDYLRSAQMLSKGIDPASEQPVKIYLELAQLKASGYRLYWFYP